jgi:lipopolysaccharide heptosyltransferase II
MTSPAIGALEASGRQVTLLTSPAGAEAGRLLESLEAVWTYEAPWMKATAARDDSAIDHEMIRRLKDGRFDGAIIFTVFSQNPLPAALLCYLADIPLRAAFCRENPYQLLTDWLPELEPTDIARHEVERQLALVDHLGVKIESTHLTLQVNPMARERVRRRLAIERVSGNRWLVIHPGASAASRRYPVEQFVQVARKLASDHGFTIVLSGSSEERCLTAAIAGGLSGAVHDWSGNSSLAELAALIEMAPLFVSGNTGPVHIAAATQTPVVVLYAGTNPQHTPWQVPSRVLSFDVPCKYCYKSICPLGHHDCLRQINPEQIVEAAIELWSERYASSTTLNIA